MKIRRRIPNGQQTKSKKKKSNQPNIIIPLIVAILVIIGGVYYIKISFNNLLNGTNNNNISGNILTGVDESMKYFIGDSFSNSGIITDSQGNINYGQILNVDGNKLFGLKSNDFMLSDYYGGVFINGKIVDIIESIPIVLVEEIQKLDEEVELTNDENENNEVDIANNHTFPDYGLSINFEYYTGYNVEKVGDIINISDTTNNLTGDNLLLSITPFECIPGSATQDCERIINNYSKLGMSSFTTTNGVNFYKFSETDRHIFFNSNKYGFNVNPKSSSVVDSIASFIYIDDYSEINESALSTDIDKPIDNEDSDDYNSDELIDNNDPSKNLDISSEKIPVDTGSYLTFNSNLGFTVHLPKYVAYQGFYLDPSEDLGYDNVNCNYKVNVTNYKNKDSLSSSPSVQVFYCNVKGTINTSGRPINKIDSESGTFLILYNNTDGKAISDEIIIE
ncbi:MAG: hypothetical protein V3575_05350 [Candidatus Absconditabacteria bacterium]